MPRNSSGNYSLPAGNPVVPNTLIETTWANPTMSDIGASLTDSLDRYGRGGMLAQLKLADGTLVQPAFAFNSESSTGLLRPSAGLLQVAILGNLVAAFSAAAVTFTQPPTYAADPVSGNQLARKSYVDAAVAAGGPFLPLVGGALAGPGNLTIAGTLGVTGITTHIGALLANGGTTLGDAAGDALTINSNTATIANGLNLTGGNVGIGGTPNAAARLEIFGEARINPAAGSANLRFMTAGTERGRLAVDATSNMLFETAGAERMRIDAAGNVGIGNTPSGTYKLEVSGSVLANNVFFPTAGGAIGTPTSADSIFISGSSHYLAITTNAIERVRVDTNGNVGIGAAPVYQLDVQRTGSPVLRVASTSGAEAYVQANSNVDVRFGSFTNVPVLFQVNGTERARIDTAGLVGIGAAATAGQGLLQVAGGIKSTQGLNVTGSGAFFNAANKFGLDVNGAVTRMYASGPNGATRGSYEIHVTDSVGGLDISALTVSNTGNTAPGANDTYTLGTAALRWLNVFASSGNFAPPAGTATVSILAVAAATANLEISGSAVASGSGFGIQHDGTSGLLNMRTAGSLSLATNGLVRFVTTSDGRVYGTALHNNAGAVTGTTLQFIASGTYTPTFTAGTNVSAVVATGSLSGKWVRTGNVVRVVARAQVTPTAASGATNFRVSLPIASNFAAGTDGTGVAVILGAPQIAGYIDCNSGTDDVSVNFTATSTSANFVYIDFQYEVLA